MGTPAASSATGLAQPLLGRRGLPSLLSAALAMCHPVNLYQDYFSCGVGAEGTEEGWHSCQVAVPASLQPTSCPSCQQETFLPIVSSPFWFLLEYGPC